MGIILQKRLKQNKFKHPQQEALLNLIVASGYIEGLFERACAEHKISHQQYNILRILRGVHPEGHSCGEVACRMMHRSPDVTRRLDALEEQGLVKRERSTQDRRVVHSVITEKGLELLAKMESDVEEVYEAISKRLTPKDCKALSDVCEKIYEDTL